ncbi:ATP-dependent DNA helicase RecG [Pseudoalteromonas luteoviolacea B = ATCC 29581]|nr:ATP-dependent DNA helicase RecG [Pseudoalteromonas luteoviolacea B = ATCC 29581]
MTKLSLAKYPISDLKGVGPKVAERLSKLGVASVQDMLLHLPLRYEDRTQTYPIASLMPHTHVAVEGEIEHAEITFGKRRMLVCRINDSSGRLTLRFFNFSAAQKNAMQVGRIMHCFGEVRRGKFGLEMAHPEYRISDEYQSIDIQQTRLTPVYSTTEGLKQLSIRAIADQAIELLEKYGVEELLPEQFRPAGLSLTEAILTLHRPPKDVELDVLDSGQHPAQQRLAFEELLAQNLSLLKLRQNGQRVDAVPLPIQSELETHFLSALPFSPTTAQARVVKEIKQDLSLPFPMMRLVQGDVGSGKTLVAALSSLGAIHAGFQVALMAPTEILSEQHAQTFSDWFTPLGITVVWLGGKSKGKERAHTLEMIKSGEAQMVIGTHALFQEQVEFKNLALIIIDEQHRFGVHQRLMLREKGKFNNCYPHQLVMTATPIPRTLAMTAYADLETSIIDELPPGRTPIQTVAVPDTRREEVIERVRIACTEQKRQVYWVCTLIEESEALQCQAAEDAQIALSEMLPELSVSLVHGRMKAAEKQSIMADFKAGLSDVLVATTVIEVGVDVPNASLIIIENPERLGLAQLHQLRGRVGRGAIASHCLLLYHAPLSHTAQQRLAVLRDSNDGFIIAERDLEIRGPGEVLGTKQTGLAEFKIADLNRDKAMLGQVRQVAKHLIAHFPATADALERRWLGNRQHFAMA